MEVRAIACVTGNVDDSSAVWNGGCRRSAATRRRRRRASAENQSAQLYDAIFSHLLRRQRRTGAGGGVPASIVDGGRGAKKTTVRPSVRALQTIDRRRKRHEKYRIYRSACV